MKKLIGTTLALFVCWLGFAQPAYDFSKMQREKLGRGVVALRQDAKTVFISWRYLSADPLDVSFNVYRNGKKINQKPVTESTCFYDHREETTEAVYTIKAISQSTKTALPEGRYKLSANAPAGYLNIPLNRPQGGVTPSGETYTYIPNDASIGDVDGDGEYEIILKWDPSNAHDNAHNGYTGPVLFDCYRLDGKHLWRINLGRNIRAGAHYTQFMVFDFDGDHRAEVVMKTSDGTVDGKGKVIGDAAADYRAESGRILTGNEYLTVFSGATGEALYTTNYVPERGDLMGWGDDHANRSDRYLACVAYLDGVHPSVVMCRGYYTRTVLAAFDWNGKELKQRWVFDSNQPEWSNYAGQGNHNLRVGDVDGDGCDEIMYGSCAIDHNGKGLYSTGMGHGDAMHLTQFDPSNPKLQVWDCHENKRDGSSFRDAATGKVLWQVKSSIDVGRAMAADIDPTNPGVEMWSLASGGIRNFKGEVINPDIRTLPVNMAVWWDGDLLREMLNKNVVSKYDWKTKKCSPLVVFEGAMSNNGTKSTPCLQGDLVGDWREEVLLRTEDNSALRLYVSTLPTDYRFHTFLEDPVYRISIATQNVAYNQPTQPGFYFGPDIKKGLFRGYQFKEKEAANDMNSPLHLLAPEYKVPYGELSIQEVKSDMDRVLQFLEESTPAKVINKQTGKQITDYKEMDGDATLERGLFRLASYEWGVTYAAMLAAGDATGDARYKDYTLSRFRFFTEIVPHFKRLMSNYGVIDAQMKQMLTPHALDDAGAMCAAMIKAELTDEKLNLRPMIDNYMDYIMNKEYRLSDGTFARNRPQHNTLWLDDMFMSVPAIAQMGKLTGDSKYYDEAVRQILQFSKRMFVPEKGLYRHGWVEGMSDHPAFHWGRANGWAILTMTEVLDVLPLNHPGYEQVMNQYKAHIRGQAACQGGDGFWHQLLDRNDSYEETSATAIYVYCLAHAINKGWIDALAYGPVVQLGWHAVSTKINTKGEVEGTCVGTGMGFDPAFYYYRPVNVYAAHGYGPVLWAGAEMINLLRTQHPKMNDSAVQYYHTEQTTNEPIFSVPVDDLNSSQNITVGKGYKVADKPLFRDPKFDGAADPTLIWNKKEKKWFMFYTNRRANLKETHGVDWVHGTPIGIAESTDGGATWKYRCDAKINYGGKDYTYWAPDVIEEKGRYHMFLTVVPGTFSDWAHEREIVHFISSDLINWKFSDKVKLASDKVIDAGLVKAPNGLWRMYYNNERDNKSIYYSESKDLKNWVNYGKVISDRRGEGPKVFKWMNKYFMIVDNWNGLGVYSSDDMEKWVRQPQNILQGGGNGPDDGTQGQHADVVVSNDRAYIFYFTHPGRVGAAAKTDTPDTRRTTIHVAELKYINGEIVCNRDLPVYINLK